MNYPKTMYDCPLCGKKIGGPDKQGSFVCNRCGCAWIATIHFRWEEKGCNKYMKEVTFRPSAIERLAYESDPS